VILRVIGDESVSRDEKDRLRSSLILLFMASLSGFCFV